jgi:hypothetical protein
MLPRPATPWRLPKRVEGEVRYIGEIGADAESVRRFVTKLEERHVRLLFCYEAGPTDYGLYRRLINSVISVPSSRRHSSCASQTTG